MKNLPLYRRLIFAANGIRIAFQNEATFRTQLILGLMATLAMIVLHASELEWAIFILTCSAVLSAELLNTALEHIVDRLHPEIHPMIAAAKDCAAGAVLVLSVGSVGIFVAILYRHR